MTLSLIILFSSSNVILFFLQTFTSRFTLEINGSSRLIKQVEFIVIKSLSNKIVSFLVDSIITPIPLLLAPFLVKSYSTKVKKSDELDILKTSSLLVILDFAKGKN